MSFVPGFLQPGASQDVHPAGSRPKPTAPTGHNLGGAFKAFEKINKILLSPIGENIKCHKALPGKSKHAWIPGMSLPIH